MLFDFVLTRYYIETGAGFSYMFGCCEFLGSHSPCLVLGAFTL